MSWADLLKKLKEGAKRKEANRPAQRWSRLERNVLIKSMASQMPILAPFLMVIALVAVYIVAGRLQSFIVEVRESSAVKDSATYAIEKSPIPFGDVQKIERVIARNYPDVRVEANSQNSGVITISVDAREHFHLWMMALYSLQSHQKNTAWEATEICLGRCGGPAATAKIKGFVQRVVEKR